LEKSSSSSTLIFILKIKIIQTNQIKLNLYNSYPNSNQLLLLLLVFHQTQQQKHCLLPLKKTTLSPYFIFQLFYFISNYVAFIYFKIKKLHGQHVTCHPHQFWLSQNQRGLWFCNGVKLKGAKMLFSNLGGQNYKFVKLGWPKVHFTPKNKYNLFFINKSMCVGFWRLTRAKADKG